VQHCERVVAAAMLLPRACESDPPAGRDGGEQSCSASGTSIASAPPSPLQRANLRLVMGAPFGGLRKAKEHRLPPLEAPADGQADPQRKVLVLRSQELERERPVSALELLQPGQCCGDCWCVRIEAES
jgi:hypothetical protein